MIKNYCLTAVAPSGITTSWWSNYIKYIMESYGLNSYYEAVSYMDNDLHLHWSGSLGSDEISIIGLGSTKISTIEFHTAVFADEQSKTAFLLRFG